jgi:hypothetical protein
MRGGGELDQEILVNMENGIELNPCGEPLSCAKIRGLEKRPCTGRET